MTRKEAEEILRELEGEVQDTDEWRASAQGEATIRDLAMLRSALAEHPDSDEVEVQEYR